MKLDKDVVKILNKFEKNKFKAYIVGGAVRDYLLGYDINDYDIATDAKPEEVTEIFEKVIPTGVKYGTVTLVYNNKNYEITTFRKDFDYINNRKPDKVVYSEDIDEDIKRRDFTINSLYCDSKGRIRDKYSGVKDIKSKIIRTIGNPDERFKEDALRMIRAVRFMATLGFKIEEKTKNSIVKNHQLIENVSAERIKTEFDRILLSNNPGEGIRTLTDTNLMKYIIPELYKTVDFDQHSKYHDKNVYDHTIAVVENIEPKLDLRLAALLHDISKPESFTLDEELEGHFKGHHIKSADKSVEILKRLRYDNKTIENVRVLIRYHYLKDISIKEKGVKRFINNVGKERLDDIFKLNIADIKGKADMRSIDKVYNLQKKCKEIFEKQEPLSIKDLKINGNDIIKTGVKEGKKVGEVLQYLLEKVLENPALNNRKDLLEITKNYLD
ncbi:MAG TPA: CCA tRNA nucleotidyltransferase [Clostridiales bacterium]|nr:CCA tRNA nucleotidyltransferase [Clostridiales bacterium]